MLPRVVHWTFHSPLRLVVVSLTVAGFLAGGAALAAVQPSAGVRPQSQPTTMSSPTPAPVTPRPAPTPAPAELVSAATRDQATAAARELVHAWAGSRAGTSHAEWLRAIRPLATAALYRGLRATDAGRLPGGEVEEVNLEQLGPYAGAGTVALSSGLVLEVQLVAAHGRWVVADIRPAGS